jgi:hypothetical protein
MTQSKLNTSMREGIAGEPATAVKTRNILSI